MEIKLAINPVYHDFVLGKSKAVQKPIRLIWGGRASGKSYAVAQSVLIDMLTKENYFIAFVRKVKESIRDSQYREFKNITRDTGTEHLFEFLINPMKIRCRLNNNEITCSAIDEPEKIKSLSRCNRIWIEEATQITFDDYITISLSLRGEERRYLDLTFNPEKSSWIKDYFFFEDGKTIKNPDLVYNLHTTYLDNRYAGEDIQLKFEQLLEMNESLYRLNVLGDWIEPEDRIFKNIVVVPELPADLKCEGYGADFGYNDPCTLVHCGYKDKTIYIDECIYQSGLTDEAFAQLCYKVIPFENRNKVIVCDSSKPSSIMALNRRELRALGVQKTYKTSRGFRYDVINEMLNYQIAITERSIHARREFANYSWQKRNSQVLDEPVDYDDHTIDAVKYWFWHHHNVIRMLLDKNMGKTFVGYSLSDAMDSVFESPRAFISSSAFRNRDIV